MFPKLLLVAVVEAEADEAEAAGDESDDEAEAVPPEAEAAPVAVVEAEADEAEAVEAEAAPVAVAEAEATAVVPTAEQAREDRNVVVWIRAMSLELSARRVGQTYDASTGAKWARALQAADKTGITLTEAENKQAIAFSRWLSGMQYSTQTGSLRSRMGTVAQSITNEELRQAVNDLIEVDKEIPLSNELQAMKTAAATEEGKKVIAVGAIMAGKKAVQRFQVSRGVRDKVRFEKALAKLGESLSKLLEDVNKTLQKPLSSAKQLLVNWTVVGIKSVPEEARVNRAIEILESPDVQESYMVVGSRPVAMGPDQDAIPQALRLLKFFESIRSQIENDESFTIDANFVEAFAVEKQRQDEVNAQRLNRLAIVLSAVRAYTDDEGTKCRINKLLRRIDKQMARLGHTYDSQISIPEDQSLVRFVLQEDYLLADPVELQGGDDTLAQYRTPLITGVEKLVNRIDEESVILPQGTWNMTLPLSKKIAKMLGRAKEILEQGSFEKDPTPQEVLTSVQISLRQTNREMVSSPPEAQEEEPSSWRPTTAFMMLAALGAAAATAGIAGLGTVRGRHVWS